MTVTVVHLIGSLDRGGAESVALDLCRTIPSLRVRQTFLCLSGRAGSMANSFEAAGASVVTLPMSPLATFPFRLWRVLRSIAPDALVSHVSVASGFMVLIAKIANVPRRIVRVHSSGDDRADHGARRLYRWTARAMIALFATAIYGVSRTSVSFAVGTWRGIAERRRIDVLVIPNGVDTDKFRPADGRDRGSDGVIVLYVGRASPEKNRALLIPVHDELISRRESSLWVVGPGGSDDLGAGVSDRVHLLGERDDVALLMQRADVLLLTSTREGLPGVVLEALSTDVPVVVSDIPSTRELSDRFAGISLVPVDAPASVWADAIEAHINHPSLTGALRRQLLNSAYGLHESARVWEGLWSR